MFTICEVSVSTVLRSRGESSARRGSARASSSERIVSARSRSSRIALGRATGTAPLGEARRLLGHDLLRLAHVLLAADEAVAEIVDVEERAALELADRRVEIARDGDVHEHERLRPRLDGLGVQDRVGTAGRGDDEVGVGQLDRDGVEGGSTPADAFRQLLGALERAAGDHDLRPTRAQVAGGQLAHLAGAEEQRPAVLDAAQRGGRELDRGSRDRLGHVREARLGAHPLARPERILEEPVQQRPGRAGGQRGVVGLAHLAENLRLARHERVEPGRHAEEVLDRLLVLPAREHLAELEPGAALELLLRALAGFAREVDLGAVAGREHDRLHAVARESSGELQRVAVGEEEPLAHLERRVAMRHADCAQALGFMRLRSGHGGTAVDATWAPAQAPPLAVDDVVHRNYYQADDGDRTRDPQLGKLMLYQLSYVRARIDSSLVPKSDFRARAGAGTLEPCAGLRWF